MPSTSAPARGRSVRSRPGVLAVLDRWRRIALEAWRDGRRDHMPLLAAGVGFFGFLAVFPSLAAAAIGYGLVADPAEVERQVRELAAPLPDGAQEQLIERMNEIVNSSAGDLGPGLVLSLLAALWVSSTGVTGLVKAVNIAADTDAPRGWVERRALGLLLTLGAMSFVVLAVLVIAVLPALPGGAVLATLTRWVLLFGGVLLGLAVLYWLAPNRAQRRFRWITPGSATAAGLWLAASLGFFGYVEVAGRYRHTYGAIGGIAVLMLWLFLTALAVLFGAEIDSALRRARARAGRAESTSPPTCQRADLRQP